MHGQQIMHSFENSKKKTIFLLICASFILICYASLCILKIECLTLKFNAYLRNDFVSAKNIQSIFSIKQKHFKLF